MTQHNLARFIHELRLRGWVEEEPYYFRKGHWEIRFDTSSWMELGTKDTPRIFDVPVPETNPIDRTHWTLNLITHLFDVNDKLERSAEP